MAGILTMAKRMRSINVDVLITKAIEANEQALVNINRAQMKVSHETKEGEPITPLYSPGYANFKGFQTPDLHLTGAFHRGMFLKTNGREFFISSRDKKTPKLTAKYDDIFGIQQAKQDQAKVLTTETMRQIVKQMLNV